MQNLHRKKIVLLMAGVLASAPGAAPAASATKSTPAVTGHRPVAAPVLDKRTPSLGDTVTVDPGFSDIDGDAEDTTAAGTSYQWYLDGTPIASETSPTYTIRPTDINGKKLTAKVTPRTSPATTEPAEGDEAESNVAVVLGNAPVATEVIVLPPYSGHYYYVGGALTATYHYNDEDGDEEDITATGTQYQWYRDDTGTPIAGENAKTYTPLVADAGHKVIVGVRPRSQTGVPQYGDEAFSAPVPITSVTTTVTQSTTKTEVGKTIVLDVATSNPDGSPAPYVPIIISNPGQFDRQKVPATGWGGAVMADGHDIVKSPYHTQTGASGKVSIDLAQPAGIGVRTLAQVIGADAFATTGIDVVFTTPASPDTDKAQYWGHMPDEITVNGHKLARPKVARETPYPDAWLSGPQERWAPWSALGKYPGDGSCKPAPLEVMRAAYTTGAWQRAHWPAFAAHYYGTSTTVDPSGANPERIIAIDMSTGTEREVRLPMSGLQCASQIN